LGVSPLCVDATDKLDPFKRVTPTNRELKAQGVGNIISGMIGGLPLTQVIVRSSANIQSGGRTKMSAIIHGVLLFVMALLLPTLLNMIPLATLAAILLVVGYKLAKPVLFREMYKRGWGQFVPFVATIVGILLTDLLMGIGIGLVVGIFFILIQNMKNPYYFHEKVTGDNQEKIEITLAENVTFLNKASMLKKLNAIEHNKHVLIDASKSVYIDVDVIEIIQDFQEKANINQMDVTVVGLSS